MDDLKKAADRSGENSPQGIIVQTMKFSPKRVSIMTEKNAFKLRVAANFFFRSLLNNLSVNEVVKCV